MSELKLSEEFERGYNHFCDRLNFAQSCLDAEAIRFMCETIGKVKQALETLESRPPESPQPERS